VLFHNLFVDQFFHSMRNWGIGEFVVSCETAYLRQTTTQFSRATFCVVSFIRSMQTPLKVTAADSTRVTRGAGLLRRRLIAFLSYA